MRDYIKEKLEERNERIINWKSWYYEKFKY